MPLISVDTKIVDASRTLVVRLFPLIFMLFSVLSIVYIFAGLHELALSRRNFQSQPRMSIIIPAAKAWAILAAAILGSGFH